MALIRRLIPEGRLRDLLERCHAIKQFGYRREYARLDWPDDGSGRPRILLLTDRPGWAYDVRAQALRKHLGRRFDMRVAYSAYRPFLGGTPFDLVYVFAFDETHHQRFLSDPRRIIKVVTAPDHAWTYDARYGGISTEEMVRRNLRDAGTIGAVSQSLVSLLSPYRRTFFTPQGVEPALMKDYQRREGSLKLGWAGNIGNPFKGVKDILIPAANKEFSLRLATGKLTQEQMVDFYNSINVICVASRSEGDPRTLLEGMACGCFPVATNVGIVPELVEYRKNGLIVSRNVEAFRRAFRWCADNIEFVREAGRQNGAVIARTRSWEAVMPAWEAMFDHALAQLNGRNEGATD